MARAFRVLIVGGGYSGAILAAELLRRTNVHVTLIERTGFFGQGAAYASRDLAHVLNVRSSRMSAFDEAPQDFTDWLRQNAPEEADPDGFARRTLYGAYLADILRRAAAEAPGRLARKSVAVTAVEPDGLGVTLRLADRTEARGDAVVLALGNFAPATPAGAEGIANSSRYVENPWRPGALDAIGPQDNVILVGSGLTAVDTLLSLDSRSWTGRAVALSRRGLDTLPHDAHQPHVSGEAPPAAPLSQMLRAFRKRARTEPWGRLMDELRPHGQILWRRLTATERSRFLRHLRPYWDIHRHRIAPEAAAKIERLRTRGRYTVLASKLVSAGRKGEHVLVKVRPRGGGEEQTFLAAWLINCTGPRLDLSSSDDVLMTNLLESGVARTDPLQLGLEVGEDLRVIGAGDQAEARVFALGPLTRGRFWEMVAVPDIRVQARRLAEDLGRRGVEASNGGVVERLFLSHPRSVGETYVRHLNVAWRFGFRLLAASGACLVHGVVPALCERSGSRAVLALHQDMVMDRRVVSRAWRLKRLAG